MPNSRRRCVKGQGPQGQKLNFSALSAACVQFIRSIPSSRPNKLPLNTYIDEWVSVFVLRRYLRETLKMANAEDLNRLTACSLVLLGHIFLSLGNSQVCRLLPMLQS